MVPSQTSGRSTLNSQLSTSLAPLPKETAKAYSALQAYFDLGPNRTFVELAEIKSTAVSTLKYWAKRYHWKDRIQHHNSQLAQHRQDAQADAQAKAAVDWAERCANLREMEWTTAHDLVEIARTHLEHLRNAKPGRATLTDIARALEVASKIGRLAADLPTAREEVHGSAPPLTIEITAALDKIYGPKNVTPAPAALNPPSEFVVQASACPPSANHEPGTTN